MIKLRHWPKSSCRTQAASEAAICKIFEIIFMKIIKGDNILVICGKDRAKTGKVLKSFPKNGKLLVEGVNIAKKSQRPRRQGEKGQIISLPKPIDISNVKLICPKCGKAARVGYKSVGIGVDAGEKSVRICKKCLAEI